MEAEMSFQLGEDGTLRAYEEPYCSVDFKTEEDFNRFNELLKKQTPKKTINQSTWKACPSCKQGIGVDKETSNQKSIAYCFHCGQKLDWD